MCPHYESNWSMLPAELFWGLHKNINTKQKLQNIKESGTYIFRFVLKD
jgi:hypothetical protein